MFINFGKASGRFGYVSDKFGSELDSSVLLLGSEYRYPMPWKHSGISPVGRVPIPYVKPIMGTDTQL